MYAVFCICVYKCSAAKKKQIDFQGTQKATVRIDPWLLFYFVYSTNWNLFN